MLRDRHAVIFAIISVALLVAALIIESHVTRLRPAPVQPHPRPADRGADIDIRCDKDDPHEG